MSIYLLKLILLKRFHFNVINTSPVITLAMTLSLRRDGIKRQTYLTTSQLQVITAFFQTTQTYTEAYDSRCKKEEKAKREKGTNK